MLFLHSSRCPGLHPSHGSAQSQPELECLYLSPEFLSLALRPGRQGFLHDPVDVHRLSLAAASCWLHFKAGAACLLQVSEAAGRPAGGLWQEGVLSQLPSTGKQHTWMTCLQETPLEPSGAGDKFEFGVEQLWVGCRAYSLGLALSPKAKTDQ